jgi:hypothetical protein
MATEYAGTPTYHPTVTTVDDGDPPTAASFAAGLQDCADREAYLKGRADAYDASDTQLNLVCPGYSSSGYMILLGPADVVNATGTAGAEPGRLYTWIGNVTPSERVTLQLNAPAGSRVAQIGVSITGAEWGTLPSQGNTVEIVAYRPSTDTTSTLDTYTDVPADVAQMNSVRSFGHILETPFTVENDKQYFVVIHGTLGGSNAGVVTRTVIARAAFVLVKK